MEHLLPMAQLVTSVTTLIGVLVSSFISLRNSRKIEEVHVATNSMKDQLVAATAKASEAEGHAKGLADGRIEQK